MPFIAGLHSGPPAKPRTPFHRALPPFLFVFQCLVLTWEGLPKAIWHQLTHPNLIRWLSPWAWRDLVLKYGFSKLLEGSDINYRKYKAPLIKLARGRVLEVGAGSGMTVKYYDASQVAELVAIEPFEELRTELAQEVAAAGLKEKTKIIPHGIDERATLSASGVIESSFDTIVLVQVLCSIPQPKEQIQYLQSLLKPGGQILMFEHCGSKDSITRFYQRVCAPWWLFATSSCNLCRDSGDWLLQQGGWKSATIETIVDEDATFLFPHEVGRLIKE
ncbi:hypothetical protein OC861_002954 [Tilletia horrida]|nr:hypothetical protein OC861_002954 [Tilletia horrida]